MTKHSFLISAAVVVLAGVFGVNYYQQDLAGRLVSPQIEVFNQPNQVPTEAENANADTEVLSGGDASFVVTITNEDGTTETFTYTEAEVDALLAGTDDTDTTSSEGEPEEPSDTELIANGTGCKDVNVTKPVKATASTSTDKLGKVDKGWFCARKAGAKNSAVVNALAGARAECKKFGNANRCGIGCREILGYDPITKQRYPEDVKFTENVSAQTEDGVVITPMSPERQKTGKKKPYPYIECPGTIPVDGPPPEKEVKRESYSFTVTVSGTCSVNRECKPDPNYGTRQRY
jgi:hypothetical protein